MAYNIVITLKFTGDRKAIERTSIALREVRDFLVSVGVLILSSAVRRLQTVLKQDDKAVRTGRLAQSLQAGRDGVAGEDTVFDISGSTLTVGSNVPYAAQVQRGGRINPKTARALAIPLQAQIQRQGFSPREIDPDRTLLSFRPARGGASGQVFGILVDEEGIFGRGEGLPLYALAEFVDQPPRPFLLIDEHDRRVVMDEIAPDWLEGVL